MISHPKPGPTRSDVSPIPPAVVREPVDLEVIIPAFTESGRLPRTLAAMVTVLAAGSAARPGWTSRIVVVDNGSSDDTVPAAHILSLPGTEIVAIGCAQTGKGAAVRRGLRTSSARFVGFADADLSTPLDTLVHALAALEGGAAAAIASRRAPGSSFAVPRPLGRRLGGQVFRSLARALVSGVHATRRGFTLFDRASVHAALARCRSTGFAFDVELLGRIAVDGGRIVEIPVTRTDDPGSTLRPVRDGVAAIMALGRIRRDLRPFPLFAVAT